MDQIINVNGEKYRKVSEDHNKIVIVVADRGWVFIGRSDPEFYAGMRLFDAYCVRVWGTDEQRPGLGWLAQHGRTEKTVLESMGTVRVPTGSVVAVIDCVDAVWDGVL
jgi:hypothetical protein